ncbi:MAG: GAF domain-containing protein [Verrucomicrobiales bacterium]|jgi:transcriptional regulator with GAF, ATPase, and Fis domain|nr:GAF domain-containing protein [Verrucomicrobiales bacterium]
MIGARTRLLRNAEFNRLGGDLIEHLESWISTGTPTDLIGLFDEVAISLLREAFAHVGGCEGTVWLADSEEKYLIASYNSGDDADSLIGFEQPIGSGIISMVFSQQQPYCENDIQASNGHDDTLDRKMSKHTTALLAVPLYFAFGLRGVISCVQLEEVENGVGKNGFSSADIEALALVSNVVERLVNETLLSSALGLSDVS